MDVLFVIAPVNFRDEELFAPKALLEEAGHTCVVASLTTDACTGMMGASVTPDLALSSVHLDNYGLIVMVGGSGVPDLLSEKALLELFDDAYRKELFVAAICLGPIVLAKSGILRGKKATVYKTEDSLAVLQAGGCAYVPEDVVCDGRIITADGPESAKAFGKKLVEVLSAHGS